MTSPSFTFESSAFDLGHTIVCGIDEAGRGPWAGPVVASAVILDRKNIPLGLNDSKKLNEAIPFNSTVLEVGCGTGQLTVPLAQYGAGVVAVERGLNLAALARQNLAGFAKPFVVSFLEKQLGSHGSRDRPNKKTF